MGSFKEKLISDIQAYSGIDVRDVMEIGILSTNDARKWVVRTKYHEMSKNRQDLSLTAIKYELSEEYGMSVSAIEKMVYQ